MEAIVNVENISLKYQSKNGEVAAIEDITFSVREGEFVCIVGPSGCGKSTLLEIISGLIPPTSGCVYVSGRRVACSDSTIGFMPQKDQLFEWRTVLGNALLGLSVQRKRTPENVGYVKELLTTYGLGEFMDKYPSQLSGGMRQRAALIRTLATRPEILLLDEPFSSLDYQTRLAVSDDIHRIIKNEHKTAIMVTHDISESIAMSDRVIVLSMRPSVIKGIHELDFEPELNTPLLRRDSGRFHGYFNTIWEELDVHV